MSDRSARAMEGVLPAGEVLPALRAAVDGDALRRCSIIDARQIGQRLSSVLGRLNAGEDPARWAAGATRILADLRGATERMARREATAPTRIEYPAELPISQKRQEIREAIERAQVCVICGDTGSGKSTQLPKLLLEMGLGRRGMIAHTQPRRIAARGVAARVAEELGTRAGRGGLVGVKVRFNDETGPETMLKLMTDGMLLAETQGDESLEQYEAIIIDEAHERSLNIDFLLGYLRQLLPRRPDLKVIITSATIDPERLSAHFGGPEKCPIVMVSGRVYPVEVLYRPFASHDEDEREDAMEHRVVTAVGELCGMDHGGLGGEKPGDILVFLPGEREIRETAELLAESGYDERHGIEVVPLYARLSVAEQQRIFAPHNGRRIVLATNVAETSVTVPGIRYVVDTGLARISRYSARTKVQRLPIEPISRASADQRKGRCGRLGPGVCIRLWSEEDFAQRPAFTEPEILRTNLASVILQMAALRLGDPRAFPFVERPDDRLIQDGYDTLIELGAVREANKADASGTSFVLTPLGRDMARLPIDPRVARIILWAREHSERAGNRQLLDDVLIIAAALSVQDPRERPMDKQTLADAAHEPFRDERSDFLGYVKLWAWFVAAAKAMGSGRLRKYCMARFVSYVRCREWQEVHTQLRELVEELPRRREEGRGDGRGQRSGSPQPKRGTHAPVSKPDPNDPRFAAPVWLQGKDGGKPKADQTMTAHEEQVHIAVLSGLLSNIGMQVENREFQGTRGSKFAVFPGSALFKAPPRYVVSAELVRTSKLYARTNARIRPEWVEQLAGHVLKWSFGEPMYDERQARVMSAASATLWGVPIVVKRRVHLGPRQPAIAREVFIREGLVRGAFHSRGRFEGHNRGLMARLRLLEAKLRRSDLVADETKLCAFFDRRLPADAYSGEMFERWRLEAERSAPDVLCMSPADAMPDGLEPPSDGEFPDELVTPIGTLELRYRFEPTSESDGITATVPLHALADLDERIGTWLVPGMLAEKVEGLIKSMDKAVRTNFLPIGAFVKRAVPRLLALRAEAAAQGRVLALPEALAEVLEQLIGSDAGVELSPASFAVATLPAHLSMRYEIIDERGEEMAAGRDLRRLKHELKVRMARALSQTAAGPFNRDRVDRWDFGDLPEATEVKHRGMSIRAFPGLVPPANPASSLSLRPLPSLEAAEESHRRGLVFLAAKVAHEQLDRAVRYIDPSVNFDRLVLLYAPLGNSMELRLDMEYTLARRAFLPDLPVIRFESQFRAAIERGVRQGDGELLDQIAVDIARTVAQTLSTRNALVSLMHTLDRPAFAQAVLDVREQVATLVPPRFLYTTDSAFVGELPRYLKAAEARLRRLAIGGPGALSKDERWMSELEPRMLAYVVARDSQPPELRSPALVRELETMKWMLEEYRVSLFAQELGTRTTVSAKRLDEQFGRVQVALAT
ncbi:MAG: ATP-dependent RNA helicase HrpA [Phycisphaerales bacterium]|nr:ATP-dependent RNA helicase HrpA [Phycisphaeraceae bacterium]